MRRLIQPVSLLSQLATVWTFTLALTVQPLAAQTPTEPVSGSGPDSRRATSAAYILQHDAGTNAATGNYRATRDFLPPISVDEQRRRYLLPAVDAAAELHAKRSAASVGESSYRLGAAILPSATRRPAPPVPAKPLPANRLPANGSQRGGGAGPTVPVQVAAFPKFAAQNFPSIVDQAETFSVRPDEAKQTSLERNSGQRYNVSNMTGQLGDVTSLLRQVHTVHDSDIPLPTPTPAAAPAHRYFSQTGQTWPGSLYTWSSPAFYHNHLYFEQPNLERYGIGPRPVATPAVSAAHFFGSICILPYKICQQRPGTCSTTLGHQRPGDCVDYQRAH